MITSAIILSKVTVALKFQPRCLLCHWLVLFARCFLHIWKIDWYRISNWTAPKTKNNWDFNFPNGSVFIYKIWDWELRKSFRKNFSRNFQMDHWFFVCFDQLVFIMWTLAMKGFFQQVSQDKWYYSIYIFIYVFF